MADVNARIHIGIDASSAVAQLRSLQSQISSFNNSVVRGNAAALSSQQALMSALASQIGATGKFTTSIRAMDSGLTAMQQGFDRGTLSARQYFRYAGSQIPVLTKAFRGLGAEQAAMAQLAEQRVKRLQTQYVSLGRDAQGVQKVLAAQPKTLASGYATDIAMATQRQQLFNRALQLGSTQIVNWGKNTQWAGRQLMVGFTVPLGMASAAAAKFYMDLDRASIAFRRVYGDMSTTTEETERNLQAIRDLGMEYTKYGIAVSDTINLAARAAATGAENEDMLQATKETLRLATLGQMEYGAALDATIALQTAFQVSSEDLAKTTDFLNAVENQTILTLEDMARAIPRVAPVIKGLGGDVRDLAVFMTALREGGVTAEQGANALKSGLASLINPTRQATDMLRGFGININEIVSVNRGDLMGTVQAFGEALSALSDFERQQALEQVFGKYQYARIGALFANISRDGSQAARTMELAGASVEELAALSEKELNAISESVSFNFLGAVEKLKVAIAPIGEIFLKAITPIIDAVSKVANAFNNLPDGVKTAISLVVGAIGLVAPAALMMVGLIGNAIGNGLKFVLALRNGFKGLVGVLSGTGGSFKYQTGAALDSAAAMASLEGKVTSLTGDLLLQETAIQGLIAAYRNLAGAASSAAAAMPRGFGVPGVAAAGAAGRMRAPTVRAQGFNRGGIVPGTGNQDTIPALLTPGESVITKEATAKYGSIIQAMNAGTLPGFNDGVYSIGIPGESQVRFQARQTDRMTAIVARIQSLLADSSRVDRDTKRSVVGAVRTLVSQSDRQRIGIERLVSTIRSVPGFDPRLITSRPTRTDVSSGLSSAGAEARVAKAVASEVVRQRALAPEQRALEERFRGRISRTQLENLTRVQAAHIEPRRLPSGAKDYSDPRNLRAEVGAMNNYLNRMKNSLIAIDDPLKQTMSRQELASQIARRTNLSMTQVNRELDNLRAGLAPVTREARSVARVFAVLDQKLSSSSAAQGIARTQLGTVSASGYQAEAYRVAERSLITRGAIGPGGVGSATFEDLRRQYGISDDARTPRGSSQPAASSRGAAQATGAAVGGAVVEGTRSAVVSQMPGAVLSGVVASTAGATAAATALGAKTGKAYTTSFDGMSMDPYIASRDRNSPHAMVAADAASDARVYSSTFRATVGTIQVPVQPTTTRPQVSGVGSAGAVVTGTSATDRPLPGFAMPQPKAIESREAVRAREALTDRMKQENEERKSRVKNLRGENRQSRAAIPIIGQQTNWLDKQLDTIKKSTQVEQMKTVAVNEARKAEQRRQGQAQRAAIQQTTAANLTPAVGKLGSRTLGKLRNFFFPGAMDSSLRNVAIDPYQGVQSRGRVAADITKQAGKTLAVNTRAAGAVIKEGAIAAGKDLRNGIRFVSDMTKRDLGNAINNAKNRVNSFTSMLKKATGSMGGMFVGRAGLTEEQMLARRERMGGRMMAGGMAMSMASMIPFMMQDQEGKFMGMNANAMGMGLMGGGMLLSMAPMMGAAAGPIIGLAAAAGAAGLAIYAWRDSVDTAARKAAEFGSSIGGTANVLNNLSKMLGKQTPAQRQTEMQLRFTEAEKEAGFGEFASMLESEEGKKFIDDLTNAIGPERFKILTDYVETAIASGLMDVETAGLFVKTVSTAIEDGVTGAMVLSKISKGIEEGSAGLLEQARERNAAVLQNEAIRNVEDGGRVDYTESATAIGASFQVIQDFSNAAALAKEEYMNGTISYNEYISVLNEATNAQARYSGVLKNAINNASDIGAAAQAVSEQLKLLVSEEEVKKIDSAVESDVALLDRIGTPIGQAIIAFFGAEKVLETRHEQRMREEQLTRAMMAEAILSGMSADNVAAIQQYIKENPEGRASQVFDQYKSQGGETAFKAAAIQANIDVLGMPGDLENLLTEDQYIDMFIQFEAEGGGAADLEAYLNSIPEEQVVTTVLALEGLTPDQQINLINQYNELGRILGAEAAAEVDAALRGLAEQTPSAQGPGVPSLGQEEARVQGELERAEQELALATPSKPQGVGYTEEEQAAIDAAQGKVTRLKEELSEISGKITEIQIEMGPEANDAIERAKEIDAWSSEDLLKNIKIVLKEEGDLDMLPTYTQWAKDLSQIEPNLMSAIQLDVSNLGDVQEYGQYLEQLNMLNMVMMELPEEQRFFAAQFAFEYDAEGNAKPKNPIEFGRDLAKLREATEGLTSEKVEVRKESVVRLIQMAFDNKGTPIDPARAREVMNQMIIDLGITEGEFIQLPPDTITKVVALSMEVRGAEETARLANRLATLARLQGDMAAAAKYDQIAAAARAAANEAQAAAAAGIAAGGNALPSSGGGGGGGGGSSEKTGSELLKEYIEDLKTQRKLIGKITKDGSEVKTGFAQALRNAGAPEQLIADIVSKGKDGIKMAKKLLADRAKKLKEVTQLMFSVNRFALIESQRSAAENAKAQRSAQQGLLESGFSFDVASDIASDENTAAAVADSYERVKAAEREVESTKKGTNARKKANEELRKAKQEWENLTSAIEQNIAQQEKLQIANLIGEAEQEATFAARKISAGLALIGKGFNSAIVGKMIVDPAVVNQVSGYTEKLRDLERQRRKILRIDKEDRTEKQKEKLRDLNKEIARTTRQYNRLIKSLEELSDAQREALVSQVQEGFTAEATALQREEEAINLLMGQGLTYDQASAIARDADRRDAILASIGDQETLNALLAQAVELTEAQQAAAFRGRIADLGREVDLQKKKAELIKISGGDQLTLNYLTSMSYEDILYFLSLSAEEQQNFLNLIEDSFTAADKIAEAFNQINERQEYSNSLLEAQANERFGVMDEYNEQERSLERQIRSTERLIDTAQDQIDAIEEENDDLQHTIDLRQREIDLLQRRADEYNRGLELIQRQEDEINESYDERLEALDELDRVNQRIISRQRDQVSLSQALSEGDIYAATQATKQIRQNETAYAIEESRAALEESRQNELKNISVEINGVLLNREQIEERLQDIEDEIYNRTQDLIPIQDEIYQNGLDIYDIQEKTLEPLENQLDLLNDQKQVISDLRKDWQDYYEYLQENAVDPLTGMKFKDLQKLRELYEAGLGTGLTEEQALQNAINRAGDFGIDLSSISSDALRRAFGVTLTIPTNTEEVGGGGPTDLEPDKYEETFGHDYDVMTDPSKPPPGTPGNDPNLEWVWNPSVGRWSWQRKPQPGSGTGPTPEPESTTPAPETPTQTRPSYADARAETAAKTGLSGRALTLATREYLQGFANMFTGGAIFGKGRRDSVPVMASPGEFIVRNSMVEKYGLPMLNKINQGSFRTPSEKQTKIKNMSAEISGPVYNNYSVSVTANTNANADEIANKTITKIKQLQTSSIRSSRV